MMGGTVLTSKIMQIRNTEPLSFTAEKNGNVIIHQMETKSKSHQINGQTSQEEDVSKKSSTNSCRYRQYENHRLKDLMPCRAL